MTMLTATPDNAAGRVRVVFSDAQGGTLTRTRGDTGTTEPVRGGAALTGYGILDDYEAPFGVPLTYSVDGVWDTITFTPNAQAWLSHPTDPSLTLAVTVVDDTPHTYDVAGGVLPVIDSEWPVALHSRRTVHTGSLDVITPWADRHQMDALLRDGSPLLLRSQPDCRVDDLWMFIQPATREKLGPPHSTRLRWLLDYQRVDNPPGQVTAPPANAWSAVTQTHASWTALAAAHTSWGDVVTTPHPHA